MYADVIVDISHKAVDRTFSYRIPEELEEVVSVGTPVMIPFGQGNRARKGYVIGLSETVAWDASRVKDILRVPEGSLPVESRMIQLAGWMREKYGCTMISALETVMPVKQKVRSVKQKVNVQQFEPEFLPIESLNPDQKKAYETFAADYDAGKRDAYLLHGVTGSGKTEVYLQMAKHVIQRGQKVIVLVPEIALTYQTVARFRTVFADRIAILHSGLSRGEKYREFQQVLEGSADIIIGPRSALFAPFTELGLIIIDEEHDTAYKSDNMPKYHAREVALERGRLEGAAVVLGSATPAVESYRAAEEGRYTLLSLPNRVEERALAETEVVDLRQELKEGNRSILSRALYAHMQEAFQRGEQVMLFLNRRGMSSFVSCRSCGEAIRCPKCDVSLALHGRDTLLCHYCGYKAQMPKACPSCRSPLIGGYGIGTERVQQEVKKLFPDIEIIRMDKDTTQKKGSHGALLQSFHDGKAQCLVGTQMIVKGHDFPKVTVVGVLLADLGLFDSDFRSGERCFDLLTQAAGRAGRGERPGHVVIQTYRPEHYVIQTAEAQDYLQFYTYEMAYRRLLGYPPVTHMLGILIAAKDEKAAVAYSEALAERLKVLTEAAVPAEEANPSISSEAMSAMNSGQEDSVGAETAVGGGQEGSVGAETAAGGGQEDSAGAETTAGGGQEGSERAETAERGGQEDGAGDETAERGWQEDSGRAETTAGGGQEDRAGAETAERGGQEGSERAKIAVHGGQRGHSRDCVLTGPGNAYIYKVNEVYRRVIYLRSEKEDLLKRIPRMLKDMVDTAYEASGIEVHYDFDPMHIL